MPEHYQRGQLALQGANSTLVIMVDPVQVAQKIAQRPGKKLGVYLNGKFAGMVIHVADFRKVGSIFPSISPEVDILALDTPQVIKQMKQYPNSTLKWITVEGSSTELPYAGYMNGAELPYLKASALTLLEVPTDDN